MIAKLLSIAWKDTYLTFSDRNLILIMLVTPLALSTIIALAFGDIARGSAPLSDIPIALVNLDEGSDTVNGGQIFVSALVPDAIPPSEGDSAAASTCAAIAAEERTEQDGEGEDMLLQLTETTLFDDPEAARAAVDDGDYAAAIIIPANFSQSLAYTQDKTELNPVQVEVYGSSGQPISASVVRGITEQFVAQILGGQIAIKSTIDTMVAQAQTNPTFGIAFGAASATGQFQPDFGCAFDSRFNTVSLDVQSLMPEDAEEENDGGFNPLVTIGAAQAVFFALFTASGGASDVLEERRNWTMQRMIVSPTPRIIILLGKLLGVFAAVLLQLVFLFIAFTFISSLLQGEFSLIWGTNIVAIVAMVLATALAASAVGMLAAALAKNTEQANIIGSVVAMFMGLLGGAFFQIELLGSVDVITRLSIVRWGSEGFTKLSNGQADIWTNVLFLLLIGVGMFAISLYAFNRRKDV
ncbi:MAG: hypothetical protein OHK0046_31930 [Anaerolineae bacterium]